MALSWAKVRRGMRTIHASDFICDAIILAINLAFYSMLAPKARAIESSVCRRYYLAHDPSLIGPGGHPAEEHCKIAWVQKRLAWYLALNEAFHFIIELIVTFPYGVLADRLGKRTMLKFNLGGQLAAWSWVVIICYFDRVFDPSLVLAGPLLSLVGGGSHFTTALVYGAVADTASLESRTSRFSRLEALIQLSQVVGPILGSLLLQIDVFIPFAIMMPIALLSLPLSFILPQKPQQKLQRDSESVRKPLDHIQQDDSIPYYNDGRRQSQEEQASHEDDPLLETGSDTSSPEGADRVASKRRVTFRDRADRLRDDFKDYASLFASNPVVRFAAFSYLASAFGRSSLRILIQYASKRFHVSIAEAGLLFTIKAIVVLFVFIVVLPSARLIRSAPVQTTNVRLAKFSILLLTAGSVLMGLAWSYWLLTPGLIVFAAGFGFDTLVRTAVTSAVAEDYTTRLYSGLAVTETLGSLSGSLGLTECFTASMDFRGLGKGLPYFVSGSVYAVLAIYTWNTNFSSLIVSPRGE
ncbi:MAG: hypothetical protein M1817_003230 [Caeruleum heppii]|nr:MAG: hypothetical protein M1817_003230 [Caeruleum heppii]